MIFLDEFNTQFPNPKEFNSPTGIVAIGGSINKETIWNAYQLGIFPWYNPDDDILWWCPDPRFVLFPKDIKISKSMQKILRREEFQFSINTCFEEVIRNCQQIERKDQDGTWINDELLDAMLELNMEGKAKSIEVWREGELVGGFYGTEVGNIFCGESMFSKVSNASKAGFIHFVLTQGKNYDLIDCQVHTEYLESLGAKHISKMEFLDFLPIK